MDDLGVDPFAPIDIGQDNVPAKPKEVWEPQVPAPREPPAASEVQHSQFGTAKRMWVYRDASGRPLFCVVRFEKADGSKEVLPYSFGRRVWTTQGGARRDITGWHYKRPAVPVPLYGLDRLAMRPAAPVLLCEGEKAADAAGVIFPGYTAIAAQGGCLAPEKSDWSVLAERDVTIWPDADEPGWKFAASVALLLHDVGARSVRVVQAIPANWPVGWDLADELPEGVDHQDLGHLLSGAALAEAEGEPAEDGEAPAADLSAEAVAAELDRLSRLDSTEYARARKRAAQTLQLGVVQLDKAIAVQRTKRRKDAEAEHRAKPVPEGSAAVWPLGIMACDDGLYHDAGSEAGPTWLCDPLEVLGHGRGEDGESWGLYLRWRDPDHRTHTWPMPMKLLTGQPGELEGALVDKGFRMAVEPALRGHLRYALNGVRTGARVSLADTPGWFAPPGGGSVFALIDGEVVGTSTETVVLKAKPEAAAVKMASAGTLAGWQEAVAAKAVGNPVAAFAICMAFAGPLLEPLGESSGGFHFHGRSKAGKTLVMKLGLSVWGSTKKSGLLKDWRSTANALEGAAEECNDGFLTLDEIHQADAKEVVGAVYQLANESGKQRLTREAVSRRRRTWRCIVLSSGEIDIATMAAKASSMPLPAGAEVRIPSIPIDGLEMWPTLHGASSPLALMQALQQAVVTQHGTAIRAYLSALVDCLARNDGYLEQAIEALRDVFYGALPPDADAQVKEVARRCALVALAGEIATGWQILPWQTGEATQAGKAVLGLWVNRRGGIGSTEESQHIRAVRAYLSEFGTSRFVALDWVQEAGQAGRWTERHPDRPIVSRSGWRRSTDDGDEYLLDRDGWAKLCAQSSADPAEVAKTLAAAGHLAAGDGKNAAKRVRIPALGLVRCYVVRPSIFLSHEADQEECAA